MLNLRSNPPRPNRHPANRDFVPHESPLVLKRRGLLRILHHFFQSEHKSTCSSPAPAIPESPETPPPDSRQTTTGNANSLSIFSLMPTRDNRGPVTHNKPANTIRSPSVFASPSRGRTSPAYTSIAEWNTPPLKSGQVASSKSLDRVIRGV